MINDDLVLMCLKLNEQVPVEHGQSMSTVDYKVTNIMSTPQQKSLLCNCDNIFVVYAETAILRKSCSLMKKRFFFYKFVAHTAVDLL